MHRQQVEQEPAPVPLFFRAQPLEQPCRGKFVEKVEHPDQQRAPVALPG